MIVFLMFYSRFLILSTQSLLPILDRRLQQSRKINIPIKNCVIVFKLANVLCMNINYNIAQLEQSSHFLSRLPDMEQLLTTFKKVGLKSTRVK